MKKILCVAAVGLAVFAADRSALALTINGTTDVGALDSFVAGAFLGNSGEATELNWVNGELNTSYASLMKDDSFGANHADWVLVDGTTRTYAYKFSGDNAPPSHFVIKIGKSNKTDFTHFLYENTSAIGYAVIDLNSFGEGVSLENIGKFSHISMIGTAEDPPPAVVPEPTTMLLLGVGLIGLAGVSRRKRA